MRTAISTGALAVLAMALQIAVAHDGQVADGAKRRLGDDPFIDILKESGITLGMHDAHGDLIVPSPAPTMPSWCTMKPSMYTRCLGAGGCCKKPSMCAFGCPKPVTAPNPVPTPYSGKQYFRKDGSEEGRADVPVNHAPHAQYHAPPSQPRGFAQQPAATGGDDSVSALEAQIAALKASLGSR